MHTCYFQSEMDTQVKTHSPLASLTSSFFRSELLQGEFPVDLSFSSLCPRKELEVLFEALKRAGMSISTLELPSGSFALRQETKNITPK